MKKLHLLTLLLSASAFLHAQTTDAEAIVRALDQQALQAVLAKDTATLLKLWAPDFTVNNPMNKVEKGGRSTVDLAVIRQAEFVSINRTIEHVLVKGDVVILMGNDVVVPKVNGAPGQTITRRFTNIWQKQGTEWRQIARHASNVCTTQ